MHFKLDLKWKEVKWKEGKRLLNRQVQKAQGELKAEAVGLAI